MSTEASAPQLNETTPSAAPATERQIPSSPMPQIQTKDANATACYSNFARVTGTPEELILDFGLNAQPMTAAPDAIVVNQRIIVNYFTAKRLLAALNMSVQRHEAAFGVLETDVQKRVMPAVRRAVEGARS